jgi:hypothetical protein
MVQYTIKQNERDAKMMDPDLNLTKVPVQSAQFKFSKTVPGKTKNLKRLPIPSTGIFDFVQFDLRLRMRNQIDPALFFSTCQQKISFFQSFLLLTFLMYISISH